MLRVLDLFTLEQPALTVDEVIWQLGLVQSTAYRYLKALSDSGLLVSRGKGVYGLGRRVVELERLLQLSDPLLHAGRIAMAGLSEQHPNRTFLLCALYKDATLCVHQVGPDEIRFQGRRLQILRGRGAVLSLFMGAGSQALLAYLPPRKLASLHQTHATSISEAGLGDSWKEFRSHLAQIRSQGYAETTGRANPGMHSLAVPILRPDGKLAASLLMLGPASPTEIKRSVTLVPSLRDKAEVIGRMIGLNSAEVPPSPRAAGRA